MKPIHRFAYIFAVAYMFLSPIFTLGDLRTTIIQNWPMYVGQRPLCTIRFEDPSGKNIEFHRETVRLLNAARWRAATDPILLMSEHNAARLLRQYCNTPTTRVRSFRAYVQCFKDAKWTEIPNLGATPCKD